tara:strand:+ start:642 stop:830 length:189 start_codon:yes stop_codon:yes gene_type:complete
MTTEFIELSDNEINSMLSGEIVTETIRVNGELVRVELSSVRNDFTGMPIIDYHYDLNKNEKI